MQNLFRVCFLHPAVIVTFRVSNGAPKADICPWWGGLRELVCTPGNPADIFSPRGQGCSSWKWLWLWATLLPSAAPQESVAWLRPLDSLKSTVKVLWLLLCQRTFLYSCRLFWGLVFFISVMFSKWKLRYFKFLYLGKQKKIFWNGFVSLQWKWVGSSVVLLSIIVIFGCFISLMWNVCSCIWLTVDAYLAVIQ